MVVMVVVNRPSVMVSQAPKPFQQPRTIIALVGRPMLQLLAMLHHIRAVFCELIVPASSTSVAAIHFFMVLLLLLLLDFIIGFFQFHIIRIILRWHLWWLLRLLVRMAR